MDTDGNKQITFEEFLSLLKQEKDLSLIHI